MSIIYSKNRLGIAIFKSEDKIIEVTECWDEPPHFEFLRLLIAQHVPNIIISSISIGDEISDILHGYGNYILLL